MTRRKAQIIFYVLLTLAVVPGILTFALICAGLYPALALTWVLGTIGGLAYLGSFLVWLVWL